MRYVPYIIPLVSDWQMKNKDPKKEKKKKKKALYQQMKNKTPKKKKKGKKKHSSIGLLVG